MSSSTEAWAYCSEVCEPASPREKNIKAVCRKVQPGRRPLDLISQLPRKLYIPWYLKRSILASQAIEWQGLLSVCMSATTTGESYYCALLVAYKYVRPHVKHTDSPNTRAANPQKQLH
jgi:hypothetical protein